MPAKNSILRFLQIFFPCALAVMAAFVLFAAEPLKYGDNYEGGRVVYLLPIDKMERGRVPVPVQHGVIAAISDLPATLTWSDAKATCDSLTLKGFTDWSLPGKEDLNRLFLSKVVLGGFQNEEYWSSSASAPDSAWSQRFLDGQGRIRSKEERLRVRPIRKF